MKFMVYCFMYKLLPLVQILTQVYLFHILTHILILSFHLNICFPVSLPFSYLYLNYVHIFHLFHAHCISVSTHLLWSNLKYLMYSINYRVLHLIFSISLLRLLLCIQIFSLAFSSTTTQVYAYSWDKKWRFTQI
jgi:hypothetical protein